MPTADELLNEQPTAGELNHGACGVPFLPMSDL